MRRSRFHIRDLIVCATLPFVCLAIAPTALADECAADAVQARGEPSILRSIARIKAIGNWRVKVRRMADLGPPYDNWRRANAQIVRCVDNDRTVICTVEARPCRR